MEFGHYSRLEQLQKRLWYFSYLKYPISSVYHFITNSLTPIVSAEQPSIVYTRPCAGCLRCQPALIEQYQATQQPPTTSFFSRVYQSKRAPAKPTPVPAAPPVENPDCGVEYCLNDEQQPIQLWARLHSNGRDFQIDVSNELQRFNYSQATYPRQALDVQRVRFSPNGNLIPKQMLINHEKLADGESLPTECRIELSDKTLKLVQITDDLLLANKLPVKATTHEVEEDALEKKGIFLFPRRRQAATHPRAVV